MTKELAREYLNDFLKENELPVYDVKVKHFEFHSENQDYKIQEYTFRYLLSIAYDLEIK